MTADHTETLWMAVRTDLAGSRYLMRDNFPSQMAAQAYIGDLLARQQKQHGQDYDVHGYTPETRAQRIAELKLIL